jgi:membrane associated rhomboid family serine protease
MTSASVGFHCPECIAEGRASTRPVRTRLGAAVPTRPYVVLTLIALNVAAFVWQYVAGSDEVIQAWAMQPLYVAGLDEYYRLFSSMFLHFGLLHIGFNMLVLWLLGPQLEYVLGHVRFALLYLLAGLGGAVASFWFSDPLVFAGGASGAIFGLMGAFVVVGRALRSDISQVVGLIAINVVIGFVIPNTDWRAHLGGLVVGALVAAVFAYAPARGRMVWQVLGVLAVAGVLTVLVVVRDQQLTETLVDAGRLLAAPAGGGPSPGATVQ